MMNPFMWLASWREIRVAYKYATEILNLCMLHGINYENFKVESGEGIRASVSMRCSRKDAALLISQLDKLGIVCEIVGEGGLLGVLDKIRRRSGLAIGFLTAVVLLALSGEFVWDIRVSGNANMSDEEVIEELRECGFSLGTRIDKVDINKLENRVSARSDSIAWISVNVSGTVASVQVRERQLPGNKENASPNPANLVSRFDGQIEELLIYEGWSAVKIGQAVREGDVLVSGRRETEDGKVFYTSASGEVLARVYKNFLVEIPLEYELRVQSGKEYSEKYLNFFSKSVKIQKKGRKIPTSYDIIKNEVELSFPDDKSLPISLTEVKYVPTVTVAKTRNYDEATDLAYVELNRKIAEECKDDQLLSKTITTEITDSAVILRCEILCICNIAARVEFSPDTAP